MAIEVELFDDLDAVARDAEGALDRDRQAHLYDRLDWFRLTQRLCPDSRNILVARAQDSLGRRAWLFLADKGRRAEALASWYTLAYRPIFAGPESASFRSKVLLRRQEPSWLAVPNISEASHLGSCLRRSTDASTPEEERAHLLEAVAGRLRERFDGIMLAPVPDLDLLAAFAKAGWSGRATRISSNWLADSANRSFADYWAKRPGSLRATVRRKGRNSAVDFRMISYFDDAAWTDYETVYRSSWKPVEGAPAFLRALARQEGAAGTLRLGLAYRAGQPIAAQFWLVENGVATIHKLAHVEAARHLSPGTLLSEAMFRHVIERDRPRLIDFGTGDDGYKADWMDRHEPLWHLDLFNRRTMRGRLGAVRAGLSALVRRHRND